MLYGGPKLFAAGADVKEMSGLSYAEMASVGSRRLQDTFTAVARIGKPVIAAVTGYALGGGLELALCADFLFLGQSARVGQPEILLGIMPGAGGTQRLPRLIGPARAKDIIYTGRFVDAAEALLIGLADKVVADDQVYETALELAARYAGGPAIALRAAKDAIDRGLEADLDTGAGDRAAELRRAVRHRGRAGRNAEFPGEWPWEGQLLRQLTQDPEPDADKEAAAMMEPAENPSLDMVAAALRADSADIAIYARVLTESLGDSLPPGCVTVDRDQSMSDRMRGRPAP